jgi:hypothetical protein
MPEHASRRTVALYDQFEDERRVADWGGDELFTRMPRPRAVDDAPAPRFRPYLAASDSPAPGSEPATRDAPVQRRAGSLALVESPADRAAADSDRRGDRGSAEDAMLERAQRLGLALVEPLHRWDESGAMIESQPAARKTKLITGHPGDPARPLAALRAERRRPPRTPVQWVGTRPERIVAWAFALGLLLILIAITTASAASP